MSSAQGNTGSHDDNPFAPDTSSLEATTESILSQIASSSVNRPSDRSRSSKSSVFANNNYVSTSSNAAQGGGRILRRGTNDSDQSSPLLEKFLTKGDERSQDKDSDIGGRQKNEEIKKNIPDVRKDIGTIYTKDSQRVEEDDGRIGIQGSDFIDYVSDDEYEAEKRATILSPEKKPSVSRRSLSEERTICGEMEMMCAEDSIQDFIAHDEISGANRHSWLNRYMEDLLTNSDRNDESRSSSASTSPSRKSSSTTGLQAGKTKKIRNVNNFPVIEDADYDNLNMVSQLALSSSDSDLEADVLIASSRLPAFDDGISATSALKSSVAASPTNSQPAEAVNAVQTYVNESLHNTNSASDVEAVEQKSLDNRKCDNDINEVTNLSSTTKSNHEDESFSTRGEETNRPTQSIMERIRR